MFESAVKQFEYLKALGEETALIVKELTEGTNLAVYEDTSPNALNDAEVIASYNKAVDACRTWLKAVLAAEVVSETEKDISAAVSLLLPDRRLDVTIYTSEFPFGGGINADIEEKIHTPIGTMSLFVYRMLVDIPDNPVRELYGFFEDLLHQLHNIIIMPNHRDGDDDMLSMDMLEEEGIIDVLGVYKVDSLFYNIRDFFDKYAVKGGRVNG